MVITVEREDAEGYVLVGAGDCWGEAALIRLRDYPMDSNYVFKVWSNGRLVEESYILGGDSVRGFDIIRTPSGSLIDFPSSNRDLLTITNDSKNFKVYLLKSDGSFEKIGNYQDKNLPYEEISKVIYLKDFVEKAKELNAKVTKYTFEKLYHYTTGAPIDYSVVSKNLIDELLVEDVPSASSNAFNK